MAQVSIKSQRRDMEAPEYDTTVLVEVPVNYIPLVLQSLEEWKLPYHWVDDANLETACEGLSRFGEGLLMGIQDITPALNRVYMAIRQLSAGEVFALVNGEQPVLPLVPPALPADIPNGLLRQMRDEQGILPSGWPFGIGDRPATTADIVARLNVSDGDEIERVQGVLDTLNAASDGASIFNAVRGFFSDGAAISVEGLELGTLLASTMANAAMMGLQGAQLDELIAQLTALNASITRLVASTDGGLDPRPASNLLSEAIRTADNTAP